MKDLGEPRRTGFYGGAFERAQRTGEPMLAIAFRRSSTSTVEIFKLDKPEDADAIMVTLLREGGALENIWPVTMRVGKIEDVKVRATFPKEAP